MLRTRIRSSLAAFALLGLVTTGCEVKPFRVQLPGFEAAQVRGLWVWRASPGTGDFERYAQIEFGDVIEEAGIELMQYSVTIGGNPLVFATRVKRAAESPEDVILHLSFGPDAGTFKVSSYNAVGESALSEGTIVY